MFEADSMMKLYGPNFSGQYASNQGWGTLEGVQRNGDFKSFLTNGLGDVFAYSSPYAPELVPYIHRDGEGSWAFRSRASCSYDGSLDSYVGSILWKGPFRSFRSAWRVLQGIEAFALFRKSQVPNHLFSDIVQGTTVSSSFAF